MWSTAIPSLADSQYQPPQYLGPFRTSINSVTVSTPAQATMVSSAWRDNPYSRVITYIQDVTIRFGAFNYYRLTSGDPLPDTDLGYFMYGQYQVNVTVNQPYSDAQRNYIRACEITDIYADPNFEIEAIVNGHSSDLSSHSQTENIRISVAGENIPNSFDFRITLRYTWTIELPNDYTGLALSPSVSANNSSGYLYDMGRINRGEQKILDILQEMVNDQEASEVLEQANTDFNSASSNLMNDEAELENAADASLEAIDFDALDVVGTYSNSMSFWMNLVAALPAAVGSYWEVLVFGFLIAFLLFILRLVR